MSLQHEHVVKIVDLDKGFGFTEEGVFFNIDGPDVTDAMKAVKRGDVIVGYVDYGHLGDTLGAGWHTAAEAEERERKREEERQREMAASDAKRRTKKQVEKISTKILWRLRDLHPGLHIDLWWEDADLVKYDGDDSVIGLYITVGKSNHEDAYGHFSRNTTDEELRDFMAETLTEMVDDPYLACHFYSKLFAKLSRE